MVARTKILSMQKVLKSFWKIKKYVKINEAAFVFVFCKQNRRNIFTPKKLISL
jgi:hypothetical protein